ncbi:GMC family oxidoreductase [Paracoccus sp. J55]|uniref:GMC family oxidoreductase n=1 Tax=Paracoccus sp. J55 TaxID=935849 RepID=UPI00048B5A9F|nr:GMC family oxidoreductase N-terminal domain-containing protein [Paracoccus sp. J55]
MSEEFDYIIVGAGGSGAVLAARLSENPAHRILVLEAGPADRSLYIRMPAGFVKTVGNPKYVTNYQTKPTELTGGRAINLLQGRVVGGGTSVNGMAYNRGQPHDFDNWARAGNPGWSHADLLPIFMELEGREGGDPIWRGRSGPLKVTDVAWKSPVLDAFIEGCVENGIPRNADINGPDQFGVAFTQANIAKGKRVSAATAFLRPALSRPNLVLRTGLRASRVLLSEGRATGVEVIGPDGSARILARGEVILCAGAIGSPHLLQVSGIGRAEDLASAGICPVHDLPGVGQGLRDHYMVSLIAEGRNFTSINQYAAPPRLWFEALKWMVGGSSILGMPVALLHYFMKSGLNGDETDIQGIFTPASNRFSASGKLEQEIGMTCAIWQHRPTSTGHVRALSPDITVLPEVQPNYLADEIDRHVLISACRQTRAILRSAAMKPFFLRETGPSAGAETDDEWLSFARETGSTVFHPCSTLRMGPRSNGNAVVGHDLKVHGLAGLRVADSSIMPDIPSANTAASAMVIGAKAAKLITKR